MPLRIRLPTLALAAASLLAGAAAAGCGGDSAPAAPPVSGAYTGTTSQGLPIAITVSGDAVTSIQFGWRARCADGQVHANTIRLGGGSLDDGEFSVHGDLETGGEGEVVGKIDGPRASGILARRKGSAFGTDCVAENVTWQARARGQSGAASAAGGGAGGPATQGGPQVARAYTGTTSQGLPIAFTVSGGFVGDVRFGWRARCSDGQVHANTISLGGGRLAAGGSFRVAGVLETGGVAAVEGTIRGSEASGVLSRRKGSAFGADCVASGVRWRASATRSDLPAA